MTSDFKSGNKRQLPPEKLKELYTNQRRGAMVRVAACCALWSFALIGYKYGSVKAFNMNGLSAAVLYLILMNPVALFIIRFVKSKKAYNFVALMIHQAEITGYTAAIYFMGAIEAVYLSPIYAALIAFVGLVAPRRHSFIVAVLCLLNYSLMIGLNNANILPHPGFYFERRIPLLDQILISLVVIALLFFVSYLSAATARLLRAQRDKLRLQNNELVATNTMFSSEIEERRQAELALRESEYRYRNILESIEDGYYESDLSGNFTFFNDAFCKVLGYTRDEVMGSNFRAYMDAKTAEHVYAVYHEAFRTGAAKAELEWELVHKNGSLRYGISSISLIEDEEGRYSGFRGLIRDITERKLARIEKEKLKVRLQRAEKMEALGTLAGGVAHDLNNILSGMTSYPELLLTKIDQESPLRRPLTIIKKSGEKAVAAVQDLLALARRGVETMEPTNLNNIVAEYLESPEYDKLLSFHPQVVMESRLAPTLANIKASPIHLLKVVMNLVSNAAEAMAGGGRIQIATRNATLDEPQRGYETIAVGHYAVLAIKDTGEGISEEDIERIFEPFYSKKKMGRSGTGLGMAVVWGTVKDHNGFIDLQSRLGEGTTIALYFPVTYERMPASKSLMPMDFYMGRQETVLIIDDMAEQREIATVILTELKYRAGSVASGEEAVELLKKQSFDLIILDMLMASGMDGLDTYKRILEIHPAQKAIIASGFSETDRVRRAMELGVGRYIKKPYSLEKLGMAVREELDKKNGQK